jgi:hypothetical protein
VDRCGPYAAGTTSFAAIELKIVLTLVPARPIDDADERDQRDEQRILEQVLSFRRRARTLRRAMNSMCDSSSASTDAHCRVCEKRSR